MRLFQNFTVLSLQKVFLFVCMNVQCMTVLQVPLVVVETLGIGSMAPGALLLEASKGFEASMLHILRGFSVPIQ